MVLRQGNQPLGGVAFVTLTTPPLNGMGYGGRPTRKGLMAASARLVGSPFMASWNWPHHQGAMAG